jgi:hypothetical protein
MEATFGIITGGDQDERINLTIDSIENQHIDKNKYDIIIVGNSRVVRDNTVIYPWVEKTDRAHITAKKNLITEKAKFSHVVYAHDYFWFCDGWYDGFTEFNRDNEYDVAMCPILNTDDSRYMDWIVVSEPDCPPGWTQIEKWCPNGYRHAGQAGMVDYNYDKTYNMYVPGFFWLAKKEFMEKYPLNEDLYHSDGEDIEWSLRINKFFKYKLNMNSQVKLLKYKNNLLKYLRT